MQNNENPKTELDTGLEEVTVSVSDDTASAPQTDTEMPPGAEGPFENRSIGQTDAEMPPGKESPYLEGIFPDTGSLATDESNTSSLDKKTGSDNHPPTEAPRKPTLSRQRTRIVPIDGRRTVATETDKANSDLLDLLESLRGGRLLTDKLQGVERLSEASHRYAAVLYHGSYKVIIPVEEAVDAPRDYRGMEHGTVLQYLVSKRLGAEVDYIVKGFDPDSGLVAASRLEAMRVKRRQYYFGTDRDGKDLLYEGVCAEARVVSVIRAGIFVDLFGVETYIPLNELSYQRMIDAAQVYQPGQRVLVRITALDRSDRDHISVTASVKQAGENPCERALRMYSVNNCYVGTVTVVDTNGVFVSLDGIDCLCRYPSRGRPPRGTRVTVRILGINQKTCRMWGVIIHMAAAR